MTSVNEGSTQPGSSGIELLLAGFCLGVIAAIVIPILLGISPIYIDCGCGAQAEMARQCFESGNLSSWQCGVFR